MRKPRICIAYTGGTIGGVFSEQSGITARGVNLLSILREKRHKIEVADSVEFVTIMDKLSENMTPHDWLVIAREVKKIIDSGVDGIVVTHGTDTLEYTAAALSFMLKELRIPVIITGSDYPVGYNRTDALDNLYDSIIAASDERLKGVYVVFRGMIHLGTKVKKFIFPPMSWGENKPEPPSKSYHLIDPETCFISVNSGTYITNPAGFIKFDRVELSTEYVESEEFRKRNKGSGKCILSDEIDLDDRVHLLKVYPGLNVDLIRHILQIPTELKEQRIELKKPRKVLILELYNSGTACVGDSEYSLLRVLKDAIKLNNPIIAASQQIGRVTLHEYETSRKLKEIGVISAKDMTSTTAYVKAKCIVGRNPNLDVEEFRRRFLEPEAGEI